MTEYTTSQLREMLRESEAREAAEAQAKREAVKPIYKFTLKPVSDNFDRLYDDTCGFYFLAGAVTNKAELEAVGAPAPMEGGMRYLYNSGTERFVMRTGGGTIWIGDGLYGDSTEALAELAAFVARKPRGGDVTEIVNKYRKG